MSGDTPPPLPANQAAVAVNTAGGSPRQVPRRASAGFMLGHPARWLALGFGSGLAPVAPGTVGTLWGWAAFVIARPFLDDLAWAWLIAASVLVGWWACTRTAQHLGTADPGAIVWDEVIAIWLVLWLVMPASLLGQLVAFGLFRYFDAAKPGPVGWADRLFKLRPGEAIGWRQGFGILFDDVVAALCTLGVIALWHRLSTWWSP
jgi:phosphatidylglycerophosphatase A